MAFTKKNMMKIVFIAVVLILSAKLIQSTFVESISSKDKPMKIFEVSQEDIISSGKEIIIKSFDDIQSVKWLTKSELLIDGSIEGQKNRYIFDLVNNELMLYKEMEHTPVSHDYQIISELNQGLLASDGQGLGLIKNNTYTEIIPDVTYKDQQRYHLSEDMSKLIFYHTGKNTIVTYNFEKNFYRTIKAPIEDSILDNFDRVQISPKAGYVSIEYRQDPLNDSYFRIYGADSGKLYAEDVFGLNLSWANDDSKVCYYYSKEVTSLDRETFDDMSIMATRIGYYDVDHKKIDYIEVLDDKFISPIYWTGNSITAITGRVDEMIGFHSLLSYDFGTASYNEWLLDIKDIPSMTEIDLLNDVSSFILLLDYNDNHQVLKIEKASQEVIDYGDITSFSTNEEEGLYFYKTGDKFITTDVNKITVSNGLSQGFVQVLDNQYIILPNKDLSQVGVWFTGQQVLRILKTN